jgi:FkbM family methyltransferase
MLSLDLNELSRWINDNGDHTHNLQYPLNSDSIILDLGGFKGIWAQQIIDLYDPNMYIIEPISQFYLYTVEKFSYNNKVKLMNVGVANENKESIIYLNEDSSSFNSSGVATNVKLMTLETIFQTWNLTQIDLIQINIEGDEYIFLEQLVTSDILNKLKYIQIQFHKGIDRCIERRDAIRDKLLSRGFKNRFNYDFVWEGWEKI